MRSLLTLLLLSLLAALPGAGDVARAHREWPGEAATAASSRRHELLDATRGQGATLAGWSAPGQRGTTMPGGGSVLPGSHRIVLRAARAPRRAAAPPDAGPRPRGSVLTYEATPPPG